MTHHDHPADLSLEEYLVGGRSSYVKLPTIALSDDTEIIVGDAAWREALDLAQARAADRPPLVAVDVYPGGDVASIVGTIAGVLPGVEVIDLEEAAALSIAQLDAFMGRHLTEDRVFGVMSHFTVEEFYDQARVAALRDRLAERSVPTFVVGWGSDAAVERRADALVLVDLARWEIQQRQRAGAPNWRAGNQHEDALRKYKRGFFVEWRAADRHKRTMFDRIDLVVDGNAAREEAGAVHGDAFRNALAAASAAPFRVVPFFDPGVWGGQWMKSTLDLDPSASNYAWCFDCVPEENSILLDVGGETVELPSVDDDGIHLSAYFGDANGSRSYNAPDATLTRRSAVPAGRRTSGAPSQPAAWKSLTTTTSRRARAVSSSTPCARRSAGP